MGMEVEVDAVCDGEDILIPGIMEHIERAGIHSGDSISVYPPINIAYKHQAIITEYTRRLATALHVVGLVNIQFVIYDDKVYVIEVNPRSSRTIPYISKVTGVPIIELATRCMLGERLKDLGYGTGLYPSAKHVAVKMPVFSFEKLTDVDTGLGPEMKSTGEVLGIDTSFPQALLKAFLGSGMDLGYGTGLYPSAKHVAVKMPVFSFEKLTDVDTGLGPEMKSTGEVLGIDTSFPQALLKAFLGSGMKIPRRSDNVVITVKDEDKGEIVPIAKKFEELGVNIYATAGTAKVLKEAGVFVRPVSRIGEPGVNILDMITGGMVDLVINTPTKGKGHQTDGFRIRRAAVERSIPCITALDTAWAMLTVKTKGDKHELTPIDISEI